MSLQEEYDSVNKVLYQKIKLLKNEILQIQNQSKILSNNYKYTDLDVKIEDDGDLKTSFSSSMQQLEDRLDNLKALCDSEEIESEDCYVQNGNYSLVYIQFLNNLLTKFIEYITTLGDSYKIEENPEYLDQIKKSIGKIRKKIKKVDLNFDPNLFPISDIESEYGLTSTLVKQVYKLKKKLSKLISAHRTKFNIPVVLDDSVEVKLRKKRKHSKSETKSEDEDISPKKSKKHKNLSKDHDISMTPIENGKSKKIKKDNHKSSESQEEKVKIADSETESSTKKSNKEKHKKGLTEDELDVQLQNGTDNKKKKKHKDIDSQEELMDKSLLENVEKSSKKNKKHKSILSQDDIDFNNLVSPKSTSSLENGTPSKNISRKLISSFSEESNFENLLQDKATKKSNQDKNETPKENGTLLNSDEKDLNKESTTDLNLSRISESDTTDISHFLEVNMNVLEEKTPNKSPKKKNRDQAYSPEGLNNELNNLLSKMKNNLFKEKENKDNRKENKHNKSKHVEINLSPRKKQMVDSFFETTLFDQTNIDDDEKEERIMAELAMDKNNILDKSVFDLREMLDEAHSRSLISDDVNDKLKNLFIAIPSEIPPSHMIETRLSIGPTKQQQELLKKYNLKTGMFSREEDAILKRNWENFCLEYGFDDPRPFLNWKSNDGGKEILSHNERKKFVQWLGQQLPHRMLSSIYRRFKIIARDVRKGRFNKEEDEIILQHIKQSRVKGNKFAPLVPVLNRSRVSIQYRYYRLIDENFEQKVKWDIDLDRELVSNLMEELGVNKLEDIKYMKIKSQVWTNIAKKMNIPRFKIIIHWNFKLYTQIFAQDRIVWDEIKLRLFDLVRDMNVDDWKTIDWRKIALEFDGFTPQFLWFLLKNTVRKHVPRQLWYSLRKSMKLIHEHVVPNLFIKMTKFDGEYYSNTKQFQLARYKYDEDNVLESYYY